MKRVLAILMFLGAAVPGVAQQQAPACTPEFSADTVRLREDGSIEALGNVELRLCDVVGRTDRAEIRMRPGAVASTSAQLLPTSNPTGTASERVVRFSGGVVLVLDSFEIRAQDIEFRTAAR